MTALGQTWLLVIIGVAALVIVWNWAEDIIGWVKALNPQSEVAAELALIVNIIEAAKTVTDIEQRKQIHAVCIACFTSWLNTKFPV